MPVQTDEGILDDILSSRPVAEHQVGHPDQVRRLVGIQRPDTRLRTVIRRTVLPGRLRQADGRAAQVIRLHVTKDERYRRMLPRPR